MSNTESLFKAKNFYFIYNENQYKAGIETKAIGQVDTSDVKKIYEQLSKKIKLETSKKLGFGNNVRRVDSIANEISKAYNSILNAVPEVSLYPKVLSRNFDSKGDVRQQQSRFLQSINMQANFIGLLNKVGGFGTLPDTTTVASVLDSLRAHEKTGGHSKALGSFIEAISVNALAKFADGQIKVHMKKGFGFSIDKEIVASGNSSQESTVNKGDIFNKVKINKDGSIINIDLGISVKATMGSDTFSAAGGANITTAFSNKKRFYDSIVSALVWHRHLLKQKELGINKEGNNSPAIYSYFSAALMADHAFLGKDRPLMLFTFKPNASGDGVFKAKFMYKYFEEMYQKEKYPTVYSRSLKEFYDKNPGLSVSQIYEKAKRELSITVDVTAKFISGD